VKYNATLNSIKAFNEFLGGKWRLVIIDQLFSNTQRFKDLLVNIDGITPRMLTKELRSLEKVNLIEKEVYREVPPRVEYSLTDKGVKLFPLLENIKATGDIFLEEIKENPSLLNALVVEHKAAKSKKAIRSSEILDIIVDENTDTKFVKIDVNKEISQLPIRQQTHSTKKRIEDIILDEVNQDNIQVDSDINIQYTGPIETPIDEVIMNEEAQKVEKKKKESKSKPEKKQFVQLELF
jgi:DNA-binding HxlR family transcriptional regulator